MYLKSKTKMYYIASYQSLDVMIVVFLFSGFVSLFSPDPACKARFTPVNCGWGTVQFYVRFTQAFRCNPIDFN